MADDVEGLRERKKRATRTALAIAARELVDEHGLDAVTVDDIAGRADVSVRTFFNYFECKEHAVVGVDPAVLTELADDLRGRPSGESPTEALRAVLFAGADLEAWSRRWELRNELVRRWPALLPRHLQAMVEVELALAAALADRLGTDPVTDPYPRVLVASSLAVVRSSLAWWWESPDRAVAPTDVVHRMFDVVLGELVAPS